ncbi:hypothetical protein DENSPDRAFT_696854 [Dentipellis sp. KUC8613]|nr:hypothetical protein DENSPDRAFT_696854 [Dentipellis sp. KUC8613]
MSRVFRSRKSSAPEDEDDSDYASRPTTRRILTNTSTRTPHTYSTSATPQSMRSPAQVSFAPSDFQVTISRPGSPGWPNHFPSRHPTFATVNPAEAELEEDRDGISFRAPLKRRTQQDQDKDDEAARKKALKELVQSWMDRLQLISLITTFFAATEAQLLGSTTPSSDGPISRTLIASNAGLVAALVLHVFAAIISFLAAFYLIRYKVKEATVEELKAEGFPAASPCAAEAQNHTQIPSSGSRPPSQTASIYSHEPKLSTPAPSIHDHSRPTPIALPTTAPPRPAPMPAQPTDSTDSGASKEQSTGLRRLEMDLLGETPVFSRNPHLEQVGPFRSRQPPTELLQRAHSLCIALSAIGFVSAMLGIVCYAWAVQPRAVGIVASVATAVCVFGSIGVMGLV